VRRTPFADVRAGCGIEAVMTTVPCLRAAWYIGTVVTVDRIQTGLRLERTMLKVLKGLAEYLDLSLGELVEGIVLHVFEGRAPFGPEALRVIAQLREVYGLQLRAEDSHQLTDQESQS
jgi:hypothetical protein